MEIDTAIESAVFGELLQKWAAKRLLIPPGKLVTRRMIAEGLPYKKVRDKDFDEDPFVGTAMRTAPHAAFD